MVTLQRPLFFPFPDLRTAQNHRCEDMAEPTISGGLVEISTVATLIGAPIAEALVHGLRGAGGLAWAPMSSFGLLHVIKACLAAAVPDWARESIGLRNQHVDDALGLVFPLRPTEAIKNRVDLGDARAVLIDKTPRQPKWWPWAARRRGYTRDSNGGGETTSENKPETKGVEGGGGSGAPEGSVPGPFSTPAAKTSGEPRISRLYCLDRKTALLLAAVRRQVDGGEVPIYRYLPDTDGSPTVVQDWTVIAASSAKLGEVFWLWKWGSQVLWITTLIPWAWGLASAVLVQLLGLGRDNPAAATVDIVAGSLPTHLNTGGEGVIVLGAPPNVRRSPVRRVLMGLGIPLNLVPLFITFLGMQREQNSVAYVWVAFQALWLICRGLVYYLVESAAAVRQAVLETKSWGEIDTETKQHVFSALDAVVRHQATIHPRGPKAYSTECASFQSIPRFLCQAGWKLTAELNLDDPGYADRGRIKVLNAVGDIFFRTAAWVRGADLNNGELYDSCLLFIKTPDPPTKPSPQDDNINGSGSSSDSSSGGVQALVCVRARACDCPLFGRGVRQRGNTHLCPTKQWRTFIRCRRGGVVAWMYVHTHSMLGEHGFQLLNETELNTSLATGAFRISLQSTGQLRTAWDASLKACELLMGFMANGNKQ